MKGALRVAPILVFFLKKKTRSDDFTRDHQDLQEATVNPDPSLKEFEGATLRYASLKLR